MAIVKEECDRLSKQAETYVSSKNYQKAAQLLEKVLAIDPYNVRNIYLAIKANVFLYTKNYKAEYYERIHELTTHGLQLAPTQTYFANAETLISELNPIGLKEQFWFKLFLGGLLGALAMVIYAIVRLSMTDFFTEFVLPYDMQVEFFVWLGIAALGFLFAGITGLVWFFTFVKTSQLKAELKGLVYDDGSNRNFIDKITDTLKGLFK